MDIEKIRLYLEICGYTAGVISVLFLAIQLKKERKLGEYKLLQSLEEKYTALLWRGAEQPEIDKVWQEIPKDRRKTFDALIGSSKKPWSIWNAMSDDEKNCYRFTRAGFEILEQAYIVNKNGWVDNVEIQEKWKNWGLSWKKTNTYNNYVIAEMTHWFTPSFITYFRLLK